MCQSAGGDTTVPARFDAATALAIDPTGTIYVSDAGKNEIEKLTRQGSLGSAVGAYGWSDQSFDRPADLDASNGLDIYVADYGNHRIVRLDKNLNVVSSLPSSTAEGQDPPFRYPASVAISRLGALFVVDGDNTRILKYSANNELERAFGNTGTGDARLRTPSRVRVTAHDLVVVQDGDMLRMYDYFGNYVQSAGRDIFSRLIRFCVDGDDVYAADSTTIYCLRGKDQLDSLGDYRDLLSAKTPDRLVDLAISRDTIFALTSHSVVPLMPCRPKR